MTHHANSAGRPHPLLWGWAIASAVAGLALHGHAVGEELSPRPTMENAIGPFVAAYCVDCHSGDAAEAGLDFDKLLAAPSVPHRRLQWERAVRRIEAGEMPPEEMSQPEAAERDAALDWLQIGRAHV